MNRPDTLPRDSASKAVVAEQTPSGSAGFTDRVMDAIAVAPIPTPTRTFLAAIRAGTARDACAALSVAWHIGTVRGWYVAPSVRTRSIALLLGVVTLLGMASLTAAAVTVRVVSPHWIERAQTADPVEPAIVQPAPAINLPNRGGEDARTDHPAEDPADSDPPDARDPADARSLDEVTDVDDGHDGGQPDKVDADHDGSSSDGDPPDRIDASHDGSSGDGDPPDETDDDHEGDRQDEPVESHDSGGDGDSGGSDD